MLMRMCDFFQLLIFVVIFQDVTSILRSKELFDPMMILHHFLSALAFHFCAVSGMGI